MNTLQVSATIEIPADTDVTFKVYEDKVELTIGSETDVCLLISERATERLAAALNQALAELEHQPCDPAERGSLS
jgi:hypothetical protein